MSDNDGQDGGLWHSMALTRGAPGAQRLSSVAKEALGALIFLILIVAVAIGLWRQVKAHRRPRR